jgi:hypothetical protein
MRLEPQTTFASSTRLDWRIGESLQSHFAGVRLPLSYQQFRRLEETAFSVHKRKISSRNTYAISKFPWLHSVADIAIPEMLTRTRLHAVNLTADTCRSTR